mmetsp:Transcript_59448/g.126390  ORF Transcript_59448/g.126390 Transcript_59448/m.126390 type:complete len:221 (+) Transcript_59448:48-710(+)|eukprot:CAMPEP_0172529218 /NCGR_PEP_ID=MMETSP1067-20121228/3358_1 /TAXON_ID=265564 ORGANISM="Thalassiosira punctigera, Strain Tpunct2005C2" /NCGR_SAMPLE_ID=MMETSP1067 /ASSEMBLY_ACC=CAM_ASM_000444 /LENGTH=220 /DNA_ID=CAMNT_0013313235 /DNA_START=27 /DNA_END=689 /DNA_ORIENTATION=+
MAAMATESACGSVKIIPFCAVLPSSSSFLDEDVVAPAPSRHVDSGFGIVGTITLRGRSAVVWFGWGSIEADDGGSVVNECNGLVSVGNGKPPMGSLALSMPPMVRNGRPVNDVGVSTTQLLGGSSEEDMIHGHQASARLAKRVGWPVFVSCSLSGWAGDAGGSDTAAAGHQGGTSKDVMASPALSAGYDESMQRQAAALAEREISRILLHEKSSSCINNK